MSDTSIKLAIISGMSFMGFAVYVIANIMKCRTCRNKAKKGGNDFSLVEAVAAGTLLAVGASILITALQDI
ncbi:MAG: hypothetical protein ACI4LK_09190 [Lentihominibacter sp.]